MLQGRVYDRLAMPVKWWVSRPYELAAQFTRRPYLCPYFFTLKHFSEDQNGSIDYSVDHYSGPGIEDLGKNQYVLP